MKKKTIVNDEQFDKEVEEYNAHSESAEIKFKRCPHKDVSFEGDELRCESCGVAWTGPNISKLYQALKNRNL